MTPLGISQIAPVGHTHYLVLSAILFSIGLYGLLSRKNILLVLLSIELILNSANLSFVTFSAYRGNILGQIVVFFTMIVAAAEVTVGLAIVTLVWRRKKTTRLDELKDLKW